MDEFKEPPHEAPAPGLQEDLRERIIAALHRIHDPEIPMNIYDLGLIYGVDVSPTGDVRVRMTLTSPGCPLADFFPQSVQEMLQGIPGVASVDLEMVWDPPWTPQRMSQFAKRELGLL